MVRYKYLDCVTHGGDVVEDTCVILDGSPSMAYEDYPPSRLAAANEALRSMLEVKLAHYPKDRMALVKFASSAEVLVRPVEVSQGAKYFRPTLDWMTTRSGTNITAGLQAAWELLGGGGGAYGDARGSWLKRFFFSTPSGEQVSSANRILRAILLGDGAHNTGPGPEGLAQKMKAQGWVIDVVGIGGGRDAQEFDEELLRRIASPGHYYFIGDTVQLIEKFKDLGRHLKALPRK